MVTQPFIVPGFAWESPQFQIKVDGDPLDVTGWTLTAQFFWRGRGSDSRLSPSNVLLTLTSGDGSFNVDTAATGLISFDLDTDQTTVLEPDPQNYPGPGDFLAIRLSRSNGDSSPFLADLKVPVRF